MGIRSQRTTMEVLARQIDQPYLPPRAGRLETTLVNARKLVHLAKNCAFHAREGAIALCELQQFLSF